MSDAAAADDYERFLSAGIDVVTVTSAGLVFPPAYSPALRGRLEAAAVAGGATLYASGIEPGFAGDQFVLTLLTMSQRVESVRVQEIFGYQGYPVEFTMREVFGFGQPLEHTPLMATPGAQSGTWGPPVTGTARTGMRTRTTTWMWIRIPTRTETSRGWRCTRRSASTSTFR